MLRRGKVATTVAGLKSGEVVKCSCGMKILPDMSLDEAMKYDYDAVILPVSIIDVPIFHPILNISLLINTIHLSKQCHLRVDSVDQRPLERYSMVHQ